MPRPADVTDELCAEWLARMPLSPERVLKMTPEMEAARNEAACAGYWLDKKLQETTKLTEDERSLCCNASGQICFGRDPWKVAETTLFLVQNGATFFKPGPKLAEDLLHGKLDGIYGEGPGSHSPRAVALLKAAMGLTSLKEIIARTGSTTVEEARAKVRAELDEMERDLPR